LVATVVLVGLAAWPRQAPAAPQDGPGGPILVVTEGASNFGHYYAEILRNEGFPAFAVIDIGALTPQALAAHQTVILAKTPLAGSHVTMLTDWVSAGGNLIAMAPDAQLAGLLGLAGTGNTLS